MSNRTALPLEKVRYVRDHCLCLAAQRAARALARRFDDALRPVGLTSWQFSLLMSLNRPERPSMGSVAALLGVDRTTLTASLKRLERRGLVPRCRSGSARTRTSTGCSRGAKAPTCARRCARCPRAKPGIAATPAHATGVAGMAAN